MKNEPFFGNSNRDIGGLTILVFLQNWFNEISSISASEIMMEIIPKLGKSTFVYVRNHCIIGMIMLE